MTRRASAVARISKSLNATINQILRLYEANLFIERTVERIIFGPSSGEKGGAGGGGVSPLPTMPEGTEGSGDAEFDKTMGNESISLARLSQGRSGSLQAGSTLEGIEDEATKEILKLYDKISPYLEKLGVDVSPYTLLAAQLGREVSQAQVSPKSSRLQAANSEYRFNSMLAFFQNNSLQKFDLFTGKSDKSTNGQILRWNNQK